MMNFNSNNLHFWCRVLSFLLLLLLRSVALNSDGVFLLSFKYSVLSDPLSVLENWNYDDQTPCSWNGVTCAELGSPSTPDMLGVTSLVLPNSQLLGSIPEDLGMIQHLRHLDLSNNMLNGSLPISTFNASELQVLSLANNVISGELPEFIGELKSLQILNLSHNAFVGLVPENLTNLKFLSVVSLKSNYFSGGVPGGFNTVEVLDLSSNLLNGSLPIDFGGNSLNYVNLSYNKIAGTIPVEFAKQIPGNSTIDLSFNNLTGSIPESLALQNQKSEFLAGNEGLCGKPLKKLCTIPSALSNPPNTTNTSSPAFAAIPKTIDPNPSTNTTGSFDGTTPNATPSGLKPAMIAGIVVGDLAGIGVFAMLVFFVYQIRNRRTRERTTNSAKSDKKLEIVTRQYSDVGKTSLPCSCLTVEEGTSDATSSDSDHENTKTDIATSSQNGNLQKEGTLVTIDGETKLELETLLKASAYILGTSGVSIVYRAVLEDGRAFAVRRIGECGIERKKDFENQVKAIAKLRHQNLVKVCGFCWGDKEKLVICDYIPNGSLATAYRRRAGSSSFNLPLEVRFKIAKGVARGIAFIHEKKQVHGNIKPSNILLNSEMEPMVSDFGLDRFLLSNINHRASGSARQLVNQRTPQELPNIGARPHTPMGSSSANQLAYVAPESLQDIKPNPKWDVYSFGIVLLELLSGRVLSGRELDRWPASGSMEEEKNRVMRMADVAIKSEMDDREDAMLACFKLGFSCASHVPQKRPSMKEALQILENIPAANYFSHC